ncbi:hypothetical protein HY310_01035, partial [Candidatus Microgenomates bacterium]|nr:hypothetical protein [Candidatus Microgenomates bacterium]
MFSVLGIGFLPLCLLLFKNFFDKGYIFARIIGAAVITYVLFVLGVLHIAPFTQISTYVVALGLSLLLYLWLPQAKQVMPTIKKLWKVFLFEELMFLFALFAWAYVRSFNPDIHGLEKYMDFGFINSILRGEYFPPKDMWFTPLFINYYY